MESVEKGLLGGGGGLSGCPRKRMSEHRAQKFRLCFPSLFCCKACTGLCASVAGFEATINEFSRLKANLILVLKFQTVT